MRLLFRILFFLLIVGLLLWGTSQYTWSISDAVLSILANIQKKDIAQELPDIFLLVILLAIPFFIFLLLYQLFVKSVMKHRGLTKIGTKTVGYIKSIRQTGIYINEQPEMKIVIAALDGKKNHLTVEINEVIDFLDMHLYQKGKPITILYNPKNPHEAVIEKGHKMQEILERN